MQTQPFGLKISLKYPVGGIFFTQNAHEIPRRGYFFRTKYPVGGIFFTYVHHQRWCYVRVMRAVLRTVRV